MIRNAIIPGEAAVQLRLAWARMDHLTQAQLMLLLRTATGAGLGALVMQFLAARGLLAGGVGALLGGAIAYGTAPKLPTRSGSPLPLWQL